MGRRTVLLLSLLTLSAACTGGEREDGPPSAQSPFLTLTDDAGRTHSLDAPPERLLALVPSATEIFRAFGLEDRLVGRTDYDRDPALAHLPSVGGGLQASVERIVSLRPDLVVRFEAETDRATMEQLDRAGIPHFAIRPDDVADIRRIVATLGRIVDRPDEADRLLREMDAELVAIRELVAGEPPIRVAFLLGGDPPWVVGPGTFLDDLLQVAGGENVFGRETRLYAQLNVEEILIRRPELILTFEGARIPTALVGIPARRVPGEVQAPGHRVGESARIVLEALRPELMW